MLLMLNSFPGIYNYQEEFLATRNPKLSESGAKDSI